MTSFTPLPVGSQRFKGYFWDPDQADPDFISSPSQNCLVTEAGKVQSRLGYTEEFSIGEDGFSATAFYLSTYDIAFFALNTKVYYRDFTNAVTYDTGITLTAGTTTRFSEFMGMVYLTNSTDGVKRIIVGRVNDAAATAGDGEITIDMDMAGRLSAFSLTADNLRINGTNEDMASLVVSTGVVTLNVNLTQSYSDNAIALVVKDVSAELFSKIEFCWNRLNGMGFPSAANADQPNNTIMAGQFVIGQTGASGIELIDNFTYGTGGSTKITVGSGGSVTNILGVKDFFWSFLENKAYATNKLDVNHETPSASSPGSALGLTVPVLKDELHGCINEDCATVMGNNALTYIANDHRFMRIPIDTDTGAPLSHPEEDFDVPIRGHLVNMDKDQTGAFCYHYRGGRQTIYQIKVMGQWYWFIFDQNITYQGSTGTVHGAWQAPQSINPVKNLFERNGVLWGTDASDDRVYSIFTSFNDNLAPISVIIATGNFNVGNSMMEKAYLEGELNQPSQINIRCYVTNESAGRRSGSAKIVDGVNYAYSDDYSIGAVAVGGGGVTSETTNIAKWKKSFDVFPSQADNAQLILENFQDGGYFTLTSFSLTGNQYSDSFTKSV